MYGCNDALRAGFAWFQELNDKSKGGEAETRPTLRGGQPDPATVREREGSRPVATGHLGNLHLKGPYPTHGHAIIENVFRTSPTGLSRRVLTI